jgi:hypothetical protein
MYQIAYFYERICTQKEIHKQRAADLKFFWIRPIAFIYLRLKYLLT